MDEDTQIHQKVNQREIGRYIHILFPYKLIQTYRRKHRYINPILELADVHKPHARCFLELHSPRIWLQVLSRMPNAD